MSPGIGLFQGPTGDTGSYERGTLVPGLDVVVDEEGLRDGRGVGQPGRLNDHLLEGSGFRV